MKKKRTIGVIIGIIIIIILGGSCAKLYSNKVNKENELKKQEIQKIKQAETTKQENTESWKNKKELNFNELKEYISNGCYSYLVNKYSSKIDNKEVLKAKVSKYINENLTEQVVHLNLLFKGDVFNKNKISIDYNDIDPSGTFTLKINDFIPGESGYLMVFNNLRSDV
ncbi:hypothetical protein [uncultured Clostridium sp.]|uniref:hypothetical protein n=1 Tax=uncultured Clostridium sp. TaxID=59620 RepID=UPI0026199754|nr:hypothetical protein [uncultured Clostridium sp.]